MEESAKTSIHNANRQIARSAGTVMIAMIFGQVIGLLANSLMGSTYGILLFIIIIYFVFV